MPLYVIEIAGESIVVFPEADLAAAKEEAATGNVTEALQEFERGGKPVWDGTAALTVRDADEDEVGLFEAGLAEAIEDGDITAEERNEFAVFLIETDEDDETDEE